MNHKLQIAKRLDKSQNEKCSLANQQAQFMEGFEFKSDHSPKILIINASLAVDLQIFSP